MGRYPHTHVNKNVLVKHIPDTRYMINELDCVSATELIVDLVVMSTGGLHVKLAWNVTREEMHALRLKHNQTQAPPPNSVRVSKAMRHGQWMEWMLPS